MHSLFQLFSLSLSFILFSCSLFLSSIPILSFRSIFLPFSRYLSSLAFLFFFCCNTFVSIIQVSHLLLLAIVVLNAHFSYEIRDTIVNTKYNLFRLLYNRKMVKRIARARVIFRSHRVLKFSTVAFIVLSCVLCVCRVNYIPSKKDSRFSLHMIEKDRTLYLDTISFSLNT